jgi:peptidoglycan/xylan/chitin deacetylase (PgdA/CDA1 family)
VVLLNRPPAVVHVDLDGAADIFAAHGWPYPHADDPLFASGLRRTLDFLDEAGVTATLFVIERATRVAERRALVAEAIRRGHRIASHTLTHRWLPALPPEEQRREIVESRARLSDTFGVPVDGFRAPGFGTTAAILDLVAEAGYRYDSSRFAGDGARSGPHWLRGDLAELPLPRRRPLPLPFHPSYSLVLGSWHFRLGLAAHRRTGAPLVLLFHLTDLADPLEPDYLSGLRTRIFTLSHLSAEAKRTRCGAMLGHVARTYRWAQTDELLPAHDAAAPMRKEDRA